MKKYALTIVVLLVFAGAIGIVFAKMTPISPDGFNHNVEVYVSKGWNLILSTPIMGIYKGDDYADDVISLDSEIKRNDIKAVYYYVRGQNKYVQMYPNAQDYSDYVTSLTAADEKNYVMFSSVWVYSDKSGVLKYRRVDVPKYYQISLKNGWNFLTITPELKGMKFNQIKGSCNIEKVCFYQRQKWECGVGAEIGTHSVEDVDINIGLGMIMKVSNNCKLGTGEENVPSVPSLP